MTATGCLRTNNSLIVWLVWAASASAMHASLRQQLGRGDTSTPDWFAASHGKSMAIAIK
jgi:hypothetical protein